MSMSAAFLSSFKRQSLILDKALEYMIVGTRRLHRPSELDDSDGPACWGVLFYFVMCLCHLAWARSE